MSEPTTTAAKRTRKEAVILTDRMVRLVRRQSLEMVAESDAIVARNLLTMTTSNLRHAEDHLLLLGRKTSLERQPAPDCTPGPAPARWPRSAELRPRAPITATAAMKARASGSVIVPHRAATPD